MYCSFETQVALHGRPRFSSARPPHSGVLDEAFRGTAKSAR
jgi:hypothetical protein